MRNFYLKKKDVKVFLGFQKFSDDLVRKMMVEMVMVVVLVGEFEGVMRSYQTGNEKKEKERNEKKGAGQKDKGEL